jgi:hypothetical protein
MIKAMFKICGAIGQYWRRQIFNESARKLARIESLVTEEREINDVTSARSGIGLKSVRISRRF